MRTPTADTLVRAGSSSLWGADVDLVKMDIEGGEGPLLQENVGWLGRVKSLIAEFHPQIIDYSAAGNHLMPGGKAARHGRAAKRDRLSDRRDKFDRHGARWARIHRDCRIYERCRLRHVRYRRCYPVTARLVLCAD